MKRRIRSVLLIVSAIIIFAVGATAASFAATGNPVTSGGVTTWDCIYFGHYPQSYSGSPATDLESSYKNEPVKWRVLDVKNSKALLMTDKIIGASKFSKSVTHWDDYEDAPIFEYMATVRSRMFTSAENAALCSMEQDSRLPAAGLLVLPTETMMENTQYGFTSSKDETKTRAAVRTDYVTYYLGYDKEQSISYWLKDAHERTVTCVKKDGEIDTDYNRDNFFGIRPVVVLDLSKNVWSDAGTINSNGEVTEPAPGASTPSAVVKGKTYSYNGQKYTVTKKAAKSAQGEVAFRKAKNAKKVTVPATVKLKDGKTYRVTSINAKAFTAKKIRTVTIGKNVKKIKKNAFKGSKVTKIIVKTKKLTKKTSVKGALKGSKVKTVQVKVGKKSVNKKYVKKYKKVFTKKNAGKKAKVK